ncbi:MAG TPA: M48 family peptidase [Saprospiraceae bacterium]|nr:M48 family peptidase [Saprospiraceae bacterium]
MLKRISAFLVVIVLLSACKTVPFTGRKQVNFMPNSQLFPMAFEQYEGFLKEHPLSNNKTDANRIKTIGTRIVDATQRYLNANRHKDYLKDYKWEFNLVHDPQKNAWCMPGGKVVVYDGILDVCQTDAGIATVMGHEIAHALANHGGERMSQGMLQQLGQVGVNVATRNESEKNRMLWMTAYGLGSQVGVMLPFSRKQESEADEIGLLLMTMAGYDPNEALKFWERMEKMSGGQAPPEILSTHPANKTRIENIRRLIPIVKKKAAKY